MKSKPSKDQSEGRAFYTEGTACVSVLEEKKKG